MKKFMCLVLAFAMMLCVVGCGQKAEEAPAPAPAEEKVDTSKMETEVKMEETEVKEVVATDRTLNLASSNAIKTLDPHGTTNISDLDILKQVYEGLIYLDNGEIAYRVAESHEVSDDMLTWTFKINPNAKFHNGEAVKASDVVFSYEHAKESSFMAAYTNGIGAVTALDDSTVEIKLDAPQAAFLVSLSEVMIISESFAKENDLLEAACGTGPYMIESVDLATAVKAVAYPEYYRGEAQIKSIQWNVIADNTAQYMALEAGDLDYLQIPHAQFGNAEKNEKLTTGVIPTYHTVSISYNVNKAPFDNVLVRKAISYMIDKEACAEACFEGYAVVDTLLVSTSVNGMPAFEDVAEYNYEYDPEKGLALLEEAGYDTSKPIDLGTLHTYPESLYISYATPVIQANLAQYGINIEIEAMEMAAYSALLLGGEVQFGMNGGAYGPDAANYAQLFTTGSAMNTYGGYSNARVDELFEQAAVEMDPEARQALHAEILKILYEECPGIGIGHKYNTVAWTDELVVPALRLDYQQYFDWGFAA
ncbi:MAG: ABC transporter substrate-binding protein [Ruminococcaceae bacterium]|nr:ABC transporter substrate-binding protein [Oscillospiraceae bacterium]